MNKNLTFCKKCGKRLKSTIKFCPKCGNENENFNSNCDNKKIKNIKVIGIIFAIILLIIVVTIIIAMIGMNSINFKKIYENVGGNSGKYYEFITLGSDNSYLKVDTNPDDKDDYLSFDAWTLVEIVNSELKLPESFTTKMGETRAIDGRQSEEYNNLIVSWIYHPDKGLEILYEKK